MPVKQVTMFQTRTP